jgi:hypothetical protein
MSAQAVDQIVSENVGLMCCPPSHLTQDAPSSRTTALRRVPTRTVIYPPVSIIWFSSAYRVFVRSETTCQTASRLLPNGSV